MVFGPCEHDVSLDSLNESNSQIWRIVSGGKDAKVPPTVMWQWADVRDVAAAHVAAIGDGVEGNQRFLLSGGEFTWQMVFLSMMNSNVDCRYCKCQISGKEYSEGESKPQVAGRTLEVRCVKSRDPAWFTMD